MEIRFRGKRIDNGEWVYGSLLSNTPDGKFFIQSDDYHNKLPIEVKMESVGQFTGLYNYCSERIYEGDICRFDGKLYEVKRECDRLGGYWAETEMSQMMFDLSNVGKDLSASKKKNDRAKWLRGLQKYCDEQLENGNAGLSGWCACGYMKYCDCCKMERTYKCAYAFERYCKENKIAINYADTNYEKFLKSVEG